MIDITEIGAGGGSIASVTDLGLLKVGPESAGSDPGPVCYDQGGEQPTVTDAALLLGYLDPETFFGGRMQLVDDAAREAVREQLASPLGVSAQEAAQQAFELVTENMANAFHKHAVSQGADPRDLDMVALGGAGPMHAFRVAQKVGMEEIFCPHGAGVGSAIGLTQAPKLFEATATTQGVLAALDAETMQGQFRKLYERAEEVLLQANAQADNLEASLSLDMRHVNQGKEINVDLPGYEIADVNPENARKHFQETYRKKFNRDTLDFPVEILNYRVELSERRAGEKMGRLRSSEEGTSPSTRPVYFGESGEVEANIYSWDSLNAGQTFDGPAVIEANRTTAVSNPGSTVRVTDDKDIVISLE
jgi:N-methylhydantoinase A